jgi:polysaccharide deacetylase 2 family uncharacterized protein YibQ
VGARPRRRRRAATRLRFRRWLRRKHLTTHGLAVAVVALAVVVVALIAQRPNVERRDTRIARGTPAGNNSPEARARREPAARIPAAQPHPKARTPQPPSLPKASPAARRTAQPPAERTIVPRVAIVIDDLGQSFSHLEQLAGLNIPLSIAVIPGLPASARTVSEASRRGIEMLLHQPMEPREEGGKNPGEGVLLTSMTAEELRARVRANLATMPGVVGVNNHMGSRFTENAAGLGALMAEIKEHGLFWLDSRTTSETRGIEVAHAVGVPALERDIFLDTEVNADFIRRQVRKLIETARVQGAAVGIGHPHLETIAVLRELREELLASGVTLVPVSALVREAPEFEPGTALAAAQAGKGGAGGPAANRKTATP